MKRLLDRSFRYVPSHATDLRKTFERIRKELESNAREPREVSVVRIDRTK